MCVRAVNKGWFISPAVYDIHVKSCTFEAYTYIHLLQDEWVNTVSEYVHFQSTHHWPYRYGVGDMVWATQQEQKQQLHSWFEFTNYSPINETPTDSI